MFKTMFQYGLFCACILVIPLFITVYCLNTNLLTYSQSKAIGLASMLFSFFFIFVALKKTSYLGFLSLGNALKLSLGIVLIASAVYSLAFTLYITFINPSFIQKIQFYGKAFYANKGLNPTLLAAKYAEIESISVMYAKPISCFILTLTDPLPIGLITSVLASIFIVKTTKKLKQ